MSYRVHYQIYIKTNINLNRTVKNLFLIISTIFIAANIFGQSETNDISRDKAFYQVTNNWFSAWELVSKEIYKIDKISAVEFVFFDDKFVYSTSSITIKTGAQVKGCNLMNLTFKWKKAIHNDTIVLPDNSKVPIGLMSFAGEISHKKGKSFFVMPLLSYWQASGTESKELGLENLITGVFVHEFSHSQQMQNFGKKITEFEKQNHFGVDFNDDIVQNLFEKEASYLKLYSEEVNLFYQSTKNQIINKDLVKQGIKLLNQRHTQYFEGKYMNLQQIDNLFLTMEGLGQYSMHL